MTFYKPGKTALILLACMLALWGVAETAMAASIKVKVEVIKAERGSSHIDPQLQDVAKEISPILNFTGFSLLKLNQSRLNNQQEEIINLSAQRRLVVQFLGFEGKQARLLVRILENNKETFKTIVLLVDKGHVLIGGPPHEGGVLLLRIGGNF